MTEEKQETTGRHDMRQMADVELYAAMLKMAVTHGFMGVAEAILAATEQKRRAEVAEADNAKLVAQMQAASQRIRSFTHAEACDVEDEYDVDATDGCVCVLAVVPEMKPEEHPGSALLDEVRRFRAQSVPVTEDDLARLERLLASASQGDVWAWLDNARALFPSMAAELRARRTATQK